MKTFEQLVARAASVGITIVEDHKRISPWHVVYNGATVNRLWSHAEHLTFLDGIDLALTAVEAMQAAPTKAGTMPEVKA